MYFSTSKQRAIQLRLEGRSYNEISRSLGIPKSTLSGWFSKEDFSQKIRTENISVTKLKWAKSIREFNASRSERFQDRIASEEAIFRSEIPRPEGLNLFFLFMGIFWGEGGKKEKRRLIISNCDPALINAVIQFLTDHCRLDLPKLNGTVYVHPNIDKEISREYWARVTGIPLENIRSYLAVSSASKGKKPKNTLPYGTFHLIVNKSLLQREVIGWLRGLRKLYMPV